LQKNPLHTKLCDSLGIEYPIVAFTHCKDVVAAVINAGAFAVMGETHHTPEEIEADIKWIREKVGDKPFGIDLVFPASVPPMGSIEELKSKIPTEQREFTEDIKRRYQLPEPKKEPELYELGWMTQDVPRKQLEVVLDEKVAVLMFQFEYLNKQKMPSQQEFQSRLKAFFDAGQALLNEFILDIRHGNTVACLGTDLGYAVAHYPRTQYKYIFNRHGINPPFPCYYLFLNSGFLFSINAFIPSFWSSVAKQRAKHCASRSRASGRLILAPLVAAFLARDRIRLLLVNSFLANSLASVIRLSSGTTLLTSPMARAVLASIMSPV